MKKRQKGADELYDLLAVRILCDSEWECYTLLGLVHKRWKPLEGRIKDYIASPKPNGYRSLHTTVMCEEKPLEIQIRTHEMHHIAEHGVASHWLYKMGTNRDTVSIENLSIVNQLKELRHSRTDDETFFREIQEELLGDSVYVFTPKGDIIELPAGATAIDFAYYIHSAVGEKIVGAKANGQIIPLSQPLKNTQIIEVLTSPQARPTINQLQLVKTAKARSKIRSWLLMNDESLIFDKNIVARRRQQTVQQEQGEGQAQAQKKRPFSGKPETEPAAIPQTGEPVKIRVEDTTNFLIKIAGCCNPEPGDPITGYVSRGRGIIVHRRDCPNFRLIPEITERMIEVMWENIPSKNHIRIAITSGGDTDMFALVSIHLKTCGGTLLEGKMEENDGQNHKGIFVFQAGKPQEVKRMLKNLRKEQGISRVQALN
jgi:GTP pyrophosphokinase